eukprot:TRINITY_DN4341_c0_g1_i4.p1 TRINITY_DN4341_c0_g1~~TRINITY_DN4341_c0_g1_i4.p1  ORF type:complete len:124 (-),score=43.74 TRINITY_DN4341_c0_g1_i4:99-419(-)
MEVIYEVNLEIEPEVLDNFLSWLREHIAQMLAFEGFLSATMSSRNPQEEGIETNYALYTVQYRLRDRAALQNYFDLHAAAMRQDGLSRFPGKFKASRRILHIQQQF